MISIALLYTKQTDGIITITIISFRSLDLFEHHNFKDTLSDAIAVPLNWCLLRVNNEHLEPDLEAVAAMKEHLRTDQYLNFSQAKKVYISLLETAKVRRHLFWRYSVVWQKFVG